MSAENEEIIRRAYQRAEEKDIEGFIGCFADDGTFTGQSTAVREESGQYFVDGDLTIRGTTRPVTLDLTVNGFSPDTFGANRASFSATTTIDGNEFGVSFNAPIPGLSHPILLSDSVTINLNVEAVLKADSTAS